MPTVYFICYGNICRSPFAERYADLRAAELGCGELVFDGAGIGATNGTRCPKPALVAARELDVDLSRHRAKHVSEISPARNDIVIAMDRYVFGALADSLGSPLDQVRGPGGSRLELMTQSLAASGPEGGVGLDVPDPMGSGVAAYRDTYRLLAQAVEGLLRRIRGA
ncbi:MAG: low molecular weight phosphatase family protein [bacterium]